MAIQFDGNGTVLLPYWEATADYSISLTFTFVAQTQVVIGSSSGSDNFLACYSDGTIGFRSSGNSSPKLSGFTDGDTCIAVLSKSGTMVTLNVNGQEISKNSPGVPVFDMVGGYGGGLLYTGRITGNIVYTGGTDDRDYDTNQAEGSTVLPDSVSSKDGTLSGFTTGGFDGTGGVDSIAITSVSDYSCAKGILTVRAFSL